MWHVWQKYLPLIGLVLCVAMVAIGCSTPPAEPTAEPATETAPAAVTAAATPTGVAVTPTVVPPPTAAAFPYQDPSLPTDERVADLLSRMSLDEKIGQMTLVEKDSIRPAEVSRLGIGAILSGGGGGPADNTAVGWLDMVTEFQTAALQTDLQIPLLYGVDAVHGHSNVEGATIFPHNIGLGATQNPQLIQAIGRATALETLATGIHWNYSPVLAVPQDIRWGRTYEGYSENTDLVTELATAKLIGLQSVNGVTDLGHPETLLGTPKHFVGDGGTVWGSSTTENFIIDQGVTDVSETVLRDIHLPPYPAAIEAGALSMMVSYSSWGGMKMHAQDYLINGVLRDELGFEGFIVSDWKAIDQIDDDYYVSVVAAINAGIDLNMVPYDYTNFIRTMHKAVREGDITEETIDQAVARILYAKFELGLFERPFGDEELLVHVGSPSHRELARQAVRESAVLLQNRDGVLPIDQEAKTILVSGISADDMGRQSGGWTIEWQGFSGDLVGGTSVLDGITDLSGNGRQVLYDRFGIFDTYAGRADVGIVVIGERPYAEGYGDDDDLSINSTLIERMVDKADQVVVVLITGRPLIITEQLPLADAWVVAWLPGSEGIGVADVLFGEHPFTGRLPYSWPRSMDQIPFNFENLPTEGCDAPLFNYGYGLTTEQTQAVDMISCP